MTTLTDRKYHREAVEYGAPGMPAAAWSRRTSYTAKIEQGTPQETGDDIALQLRTTTYTRWMPTNFVVLDADADDADNDGEAPPLHQRTVSVTGYWMRGTKLVPAKRPPITFRWHSYSEGYTGPGSLTDMPEWVRVLADELAGPFDRAAVRSSAGLSS